MSVKIHTTFRILTLQQHFISNQTIIWNKPLCTKKCHEDDLRAALLQNQISSIYDKQVHLINQTFSESTFPT